MRRTGAGAGAPIGATVVAWRSTHTIGIRPQNPTLGVRRFAWQFAPHHIARSTHQGAGRLDITITDRFGDPVSPREWFRVPLFAIDEAIERIRDGSINEYRYDPARASPVRLDAM